MKLNHDKLYLHNLVLLGKKSYFIIKTKKLFALNPSKIKQFVYKTFCIRKFEQKLEFWTRSDKIRYRYIKLIIN